MNSLSLFKLWETKEYTNRYELLGSGKKQGFGSGGLAGVMERQTRDEHKSQKQRKRRIDGT